MTGAVPLSLHVGGGGLPVPHSILLAVALAIVLLAVVAGVVAAEAVLDRFGV